MLQNSVSYSVVTRPKESGFGIQSPTGEAVHGIFTDRRQAETVADLFNRCQLSPIHFYEALRDQLYAFYCLNKLSL